MVSKHIIRSILISLGIFLFILASFGFFLFFQQGSRYDRVLMEFQATKSATILLERFNRGEELDAEQIPQNIKGFGIYTFSGDAVYTYGNVPSTANIEKHLQTGSQFILEGNTLKLIRPIGRFQPGGSMPGGPGWPRRPGMPGGMGMHRRSPEGLPDMDNMMAPERQAVLYLLYDISDLRNSAQGRRIAFLLFLTAFLICVAIIIVMARRLQKYEEQAEKQKHLIQLGQAARTITHEIKNPLSSIHMQRALLERQLPEEYHQALGIIKEEVERINLLTNRVREFLKSPKGNPEQIPIREFLENLSQRVTYPINIQMKPEKEIYITFDREKLYSVLSNIIKNANESMDNNEPIRITIQEHKRAVIISICDRGPGIADEDKQRIFDPFYTTKTQGSGVGLAIAKRFIESMGGSIAIQDRKEGGTCVTLTLKKDS